MDGIARSRLVAGAIVTFALILAAGLIACSGSSDDPTPEPTTASSPSATAGAPSIFGSNNDDRPEIGPLDCFALMTDEAVEAALGIEDLPFEERGTIGRGEGEACAKRHSSSEFAFVQLEPGHPLDFDPETELLGVTGEDVPGVGDAARWFGGPAAEGGGTFGALVVRQETEKGWLHFHVLVSRPDLAPPEVLETAKTFALATLPRFPGVVTGRPDPTATPEPLDIPTPEPPDLAAFGFVENLLQKEADGDWTRGEGLIATLALLAGEAEEAAVLRSPGFLDSSTSVIALAEEYVTSEANADADEIEEITRLLDALRNDRALLYSPDEAAASLNTNHRSLAVQQESQPVQPICEDRLCSSPILPEPEELPCQDRICLRPASNPEECRWGYWDRDAFPSVCWSFKRQQVNGDVKHRMFVPEQIGLAGWTVTHEEAVWNDLLASISSLTVDGLDLGAVDISLFNTASSGYGQVFMINNDTRCNIRLFPSWQPLLAKKAETAKQAIAYLLGECAVLNQKNFPGRSFGNFWLEGTALYLSDRVAPNGKFETELNAVNQLAAEELTQDLRAQEQSSWAFLESVSTPLAVLTWEVGSPQAADRMPVLLDFYARSLSSGSVMDLGSPLPYHPDTTAVVSLVDRPAHTANIREYGTVRLQVQVEGDRVACMEYSPLGPALASWSEGVVGGPLEWSSELPDTLEGVSVIVLTSIDFQRVTLTATRFVDDPDDCEEEEENDGFSLPTFDFPPLCGFCDPSDYFHSWTIN